MSFSSLILRLGVVSLAYISFLADPTAALTSNTYLLSSEYSGENFFDGFDFYTVSPLWTHTYNNAALSHMPYRGMTQHTASSRKLFSSIRVFLDTKSNIATWTRLQHSPAC